MIMNLSPSVAQEMLSASISQTRILQTCGVPHPNMVSGPNPLQGNDQTHTHAHTHTRTHRHTIIPSLGQTLSLIKQRDNWFTPI